MALSAVGKVGAEVVLGATPFVEVVSNGVIMCVCAHIALTVRSGESRVVPTDFRSNLNATARKPVEPVYPP